MEISITAITASRQLAKALIRLYPRIEALNSAVSDLELPGQHDVLQFAIVDGPADLLSVKRTPTGSRVLQIHIGLSGELSFRPDQDTQLLEAIGSQIKRAIQKAMTSDVASGLEERVDAWLLQQQPGGSENRQPSVPT